MTTQLLHCWREILREADALDMSVMALPGPISAQIRECQSLVRELRAEAKLIHDAAEEAGREPDEADAARFDAIMAEESGELAVAEGRIKSLKRRKAAIDKLAIEQHEADPPNPLDGAGVNPGTRGDQANSHAPALAFRDAQTGRLVQPLGINDRFAGNVASDPYGDGPQLSPGERVVAHLNPDGTVRNEAMFEGADGTGGFILPPSVLGPMVDLARPATVAFRAGATVLPMSGSEMTLVQQLSDPEAHWTPELGKVPSSTMSFGKIVLRPKKLAALIPISLELLEDASNAGTLLDTAIRARMALALDEAILSGRGTAAEPLGIRNQVGVNTVQASDPIADFVDLEDAIERIESANYPGDPGDLAWVASPRDASQYCRLQANDLQPLMPTAGAAELNRYQTTSLPIDLGSGSDEGEMIVGDMSQVVVGLRSNAQLRFLPAGTVTDGAGNSINAADQFAVILAIHMRADVAVIRPEWLSVIQGVKWSA